MEKLNLGILIFDDVEVLDFAGPFEVFSRTRTEPGPQSRQSDESAPFHVFTVAPKRGNVRATGGLTVVPDYCFDDNVPPIEILVVPGGFGTRPLLNDETVLDWIRSTHATTRRTTSVCTGSLLLAKTGLLRGKRATTHWAALDVLASLDPEIRVERERRWVDDGIITSAGVSAGLDMALYVVETFCGREVADETAQYIELPRREA
jgi:transcriptional regulator GlxA family with amidase domain